MRRHKIAIFAYFLTVSAGCAMGELKKLNEQLAEARSPSATNGVLSRGLDEESRARLELLGRSSAPTRYSEKTDENRIRVVAFDFGGTSLGQEADAGGNLWGGFCIPPGTAQVEITPSLGETDPPGARAGGLELYKGMFRQFSKQVGTTIDVNLEVGPADTVTKVHFSHNFLVLEWRRYQLERLKAHGACSGTPHVSALERGIAIRVVFDVRLRTVDAALNVNFGIAELAAALARGEATVEVSYEVVGTNLDFLPDDAIVITSLNDYMDVLVELHSAIDKLSDAWDQYNSKGVTEIIVKDSQKKYDKAAVFAPDQLAYYVQGPFVGDNFEHLERVEACEDIDTILDYYYEQASADGLASGLKNNIDARVAEMDKKLDSQRSYSLGARRRRKRARVRQAQAERDKFVDSSDRLQRNFGLAERSFFENNCNKTLLREGKRQEQACERLQGKPDPTGRCSPQVPIRRKDARPEVQEPSEK